MASEFDSIGRVCTWLVALAIIGAVGYFFGVGWAVATALFFVLVCVLTLLSGVGGYWR